MAKPAVVREQEWFVLLDAAVERGVSPTVRAVAALAQERFGVSASFTTIQSAIDSWRRLGGANRPKSESAAIASVIQRAVEPLYQQLVVHAQGEFEPLLRAAEERAISAEAERDDLRNQLSTLRSKVESLSVELQEATVRYQETRSDFKARVAALEAHNNLLLKVRGEDIARYTAILNKIENLEAKGV